MQAPPPESIWYLPHHPVTNPNKPGKVRRVANTASMFRGESLISKPLSGPDLLNNLVGVLLRFREHPVNVLSDIEGMFIQIAVRQEDQSAPHFFGPFYIEDSKGIIEKHYGLIFTCTVTRAVHLENCPDLNTDKLPNAFRSFCSRQCQPQLLYSYNGKTFVGASEELKKIVKALDKDRIYKALAVANTTWNFNPPYGPQFCGVWERLIRSAKRTLLLILESRRISFDTFLTIMVETESILNSRPLTNVAEQPDNEEPLTPNLFLIERAFNSLPPGQFGDQHLACLKTWKNSQKLMNHIWRRLVKEYLPTLSRRSKWSNSNDRPLKVDDIVWVLKDQTPRGI
ncbi:uncharacterized protein LOC142349699 [Convolutriloba macropyga]|uniref:uncharacterized protein LOC142349699 n=1 Tax=Convolutriloba macropyga TaxID=536237 RepID=UPI003F51DA67